MTEIFATGRDSFVHGMASSPCLRCGAPVAGAAGHVVEAVPTRTENPDKKNIMRSEPVRLESNDPSLERLAYGALMTVLMVWCFFPVGAVVFFMGCHPPDPDPREPYLWTWIAISTLLATAAFATAFYTRHTCPKLGLLTGLLALPWLMLGGFLTLRIFKML